MTEAGRTSREDAAEAYAEKAAVEAVRSVFGGHKLTCSEHENLQQDFKDVAQEAYQQGMAAAFKQGIEKLREREKFYTEQEAISEGQMRLTRGLQRNESSGCIHELEQLAQAAQDEKGVGDVHK